MRPLYFDHHGTIPSRFLQHLSAAVVCVTLASPAFAQTASEITPDTFQPPSQRLTGQLVFSGAPGLAAPAGADRLSVAIAGVDITGQLPGTEAATAKITDSLIGGRIPVSRIFTAAQDIEAAYADAGYILARVVLPAQSLQDGGRLKLVVVDGFIERIDTSAVPAKLEPRLTTLTSDLLNRRGLRLAELERRLLLAGDTFGVSLGSALATGESPGGTVVILEPEYRSITGFVGVDNAQSGGLGNWSFDAGIELNGYLGYGEAIYARASSAPNFGGENGFFSADPQQRTVALGIVFPIGADGLTFNLEASQSDAAPESDVAVSSSRFQRISARLSYPYIRSRQTNVNVQIGLDVQEDTLDLVTDAGDIGIYKDRLAVLRATASGNYIHDNGAVTEGGVTLSFGLSSFGARSAADAADDTPLSREGADTDFRKLEISAKHRRALGEDWFLSVAGRAQTSFGDPLPTSEQIGIASLQEVSAFDNGALTGDSGWTLRGELSRPFSVSSQIGLINLRPYAFAAAGEVTLHQPQTGEQSTTRASAFGAGIEANFSTDPNFAGVTVRAEVGDGTRNDGGSDGSYITLLGTYRF